MKYKNTAIIFCLVSIFFMPFSKSLGQKKMVPVANSVFTNISVPANSKRDSRILSELAAKMLLEMETKKVAASIGKVEVLYIPLASGYTIDSLINELTRFNWQVTPLEDNSYAWIEKDGKKLIAYYGKDKSNFNLYFGELGESTASMPVTNGQMDADPQMEQQQPAQEQNTTQETIQQPQTNNEQPVIDPQQSAGQQTYSDTPVADGFTYNTTNFDDGWVSTIQADWVEVRKGNVRILIHYPDKRADEYRTNKQEADNNAWNVLVSHRYSELSEFLDRGMSGMPSVTFLTGNAVDNATGKRVHIVFYKRKDWNGDGRYIEVVTDDQAAFEAEFGNNYINTSSWDTHTQAESWNKIANMQLYNKFSIAPADLIGKWGSSEYASISYYYVNTGGIASTTATSLADQFTFLPGDKYESDHSGASGEAGNMKFSRQVYKGNSTVTNWEIILTNRFQGETEKFNCHFEAVKGGRALIMTDRNNHKLFLVKVK